MAWLHAAVEFFTRMFFSSMAPWSFKNNLLRRFDCTVATNLLDVVSNFFPWIKQIQVLYFSISRQHLGLHTYGPIVCITTFLFRTKLKQLKFWWNFNYLSKINYEIICIFLIILHALSCHEDFEQMNLRFGKAEQRGREWGLGLTIWQHCFILLFCTLPSNFKCYQSVNRCCNRL